MTETPGHYDVGDRISTATVDMRSPSKNPELPELPKWLIVGQRVTANTRFLDFCQMRDRTRIAPIPESPESTDSTGDRIS